MTIQNPGTLAVTPMSSLTKVPMTREQLQQSLNNCNFLYAAHAPDLVCGIVTCDPTEPLARSVVAPVIPSADGLEYEFRFIIMPSATTTFAFAVDYATTYGGSWTNIFNATGIPTTAGTLLEVFDDGAIPANAVALRWTVTPTSGSYEWHCVQAAPYTAGITAPIALVSSGFISFDDALLAATGAPINTEMVNRVRANCSALLRDRKQVAYCFVQPTTPRRTVSSSDYAPLPTARIHLPYQTGTVRLLWRGIATINTGSPTDLIVIQAQTDTGAGAALKLDADGTIQSGTMDAVVQGYGLAAYVDVAVHVVAPNATRLLALVAYLDPGV